MVGVLADRGQSLQPLAVLDDNEVPQLLVLRAAGVAPGIYDAEEVVRCQRALLEAADHPLRLDGIPGVRQASSRWGVAAGSGVAPALADVDMPAAAAADSEAAGSISVRLPPARRMALTSVRTPPGSASIAENGCSRCGSLAAGVARAMASAAAGSSAPPSFQAKNRAIAPRYAANSYSQLCWAPGRTRISMSSAVGSSSRARRALRSSRPRWLIGTTRSSSPWMSRTGPLYVAIARVAETERTVCPLGSRKTWVVSPARG